MGPFKKQITKETTVKDAIKEAMFQIKNLEKRDKDTLTKSERDKLHRLRFKVLQHRFDNPTDEVVYEKVSSDWAIVAEQLDDLIVCIGYVSHCVGIPNKPLTYADVGMIRICDDCSYVCADVTGAEVNFDDIKEWIIVWPSKKNMEFRRSMHAVFASRTSHVS
jgi:hypothetical protein